MIKNNSFFKLYPANWFFNASVIGFLKSLAEIEFKENREKINHFVKRDGTVEIEKSIFRNLDLFARYTEGNAAIIYGNNKYYKNFIPTYGQFKKNKEKSEKEAATSAFKYFVESLEFLELSNNETCSLCGNNFSIPEHKINEIDENWCKEFNFEEGKFKKWLDYISYYNLIHNKFLGPTKEKFPNAFWNYENSFYICPLCNFLLIHHHLSFVNIGKNQIFINTPSFFSMWNLKRYFKTVYEKKSKIFGISFVEKTISIQKSLGIWENFNVELIGIAANNVNYYNLSQNVLDLLLNSKILNLIKSLDDFSILDKILNERFDLIFYQATKDLRKLMASLTKDRKDKSKKDLISMAEKLFKHFLLYALVREYLEDKNVRQNFK